MRDRVVGVVRRKKCSRLALAIAAVFIFRMGWASLACAGETPLAPEAGTHSSATREPLFGENPTFSEESGLTPEIEDGVDAPSAGLIINPSFDGSITSDPNAAAIKAVIIDAIAFYQS